MLIVPEGNGENILDQSVNQHATNLINTVVLTPRDTLIQQIHNEMLTKWNRPYAKCSIAADLPRLATKARNKIKLILILFISDNYFTNSDSNC